jgi:hypothetical protein
VRATRAHLRKQGNSLIYELLLCGRQHGSLSIKRRGRKSGLAQSRRRQTSPNSTSGPEYVPYRPSLEHDAEMRQRFAYWLPEFLTQIAELHSSSVFCKARHHNYPREEHCEQDADDQKPKT